MTRAHHPVTIGALLLLAIGLTGCAAHGQVTTGTPPPPATAGPAAGTATSSPFGHGDPLAYDCAQLVDAGVLAQLDPELKPAGDVLSANRSSSQEALALDGTVCAWNDESAAVLLFVTVAKPDAATFAALKEKASAGAVDSEFGGFVTAYVHDDELQLFTRDGAWATAQSSLLADPAKLTAIGQVLLEELPAG